MLLGMELGAYDAVRWWKLRGGLPTQCAQAFSDDTELR